MRWAGALGFLVWMAQGAPGGPRADGDLFATNAAPPHVSIEISRANYRSLQEQPRKAVPAVVREGEAVYTNVMVHLKGAAGSFREIGDRPGLTLNFGKQEGAKRFHGLRKVHLNNSAQDPSLATHNLCSGLFNDAGIPAVRVSNAFVSLNGRMLGFYVLTEGYTRDFLKRYFEDTDGNLYDGGFLREITEDLENDAGEDRRDRSDLRALAEAARVADPAQRWEALQKVLDVERFLTFMALEVMIWDWDGYVMKHNNYRIYSDPKAGKMVFIPHGMDQMFWDSHGSIYRPPVEGLVAWSILQTPEGSRRYRERLRETFTNHFRLEVLTNRFDQIAKRNRAALAEVGRGQLNRYDHVMAETRERIVARWNGVKEQIENEPKPLDFSRPVIVKNWRAQAEMGDVRIEEAVVDAAPTLRIAARGQSVGSWRATVELEPGRYRFRAMAKTSKVAAARDQKGEGAGLRISGTTQPRRNKLEGDNGWTKLAFDFEVAGGREVTLVCELRASRGEVWFDANSLILEKLN